MQSPTIPAWLLTPPDAQPAPPVVSNLQVLPIGSLTWENFERLCLRLASAEADIEHCQLYGERGQEQEGIDIYAVSHSGTYSVYQCKHQKAFGPARIRAAVALFAGGAWAEKAQRFVLCTQESLNKTERAKEFERQRELLAQKSVELVPWDAETLSRLLKDKPSIVDDFFGRHWTLAFCGSEHVAQLSGRLDGSAILRLRVRLRNLYSHIFNTHDPGLPVPTGRGQLTIALPDRFVMPDVLSERTVFRSITTEDAERRRVTRYERAEDLDSPHEERTNSPLDMPESLQERERADEWTVRSDRSVLLGDPGTGKSSFLRYLALDLLSDKPSSLAWVRKWGGFIPVWVPFPLWTRMIGDDPTTALSHVLHRWFATWDAEDVWQLVTEALYDHRLILLVDGLDEWTNKSAAQIALNRLEVFLRDRGTAAVVTSRPAGFQQLSLPLENWNIAQVADFSSDQQRQLARVWFKAQVSQTGDGINAEEGEITRGAEIQTKSLIAELSSSPDLRELARVPMLLSILITLRFHNAKLPQNRFRAFADIVRHLTVVHPNQRTAAALLPSEQDHFSQEEIRRVLSFLAYEIQLEHGSGLVDLAAAQSTIAEYMENPEGPFGFDRADTRRFSRVMMERAQDTFGLLVKRSPTEVGFFHRSVQEYLASVYLTSMPLEQIESLVARHIDDPHWHEVILGVFHHIGRATDVRRLLTVVQSSPKHVAEIYRAKEIAYEVALGDFNCPAGLAKELASEAVGVIEIGGWQAHRRRVLDLVLGAIQTAAVRDVIRPKIEQWFPARLGFRSSLFAAIATWPRTEQTIRCLLTGIVDSTGTDQLAAAAALATVAGGDYAVGEELVTLIQSHRDGTVRAASFLSLSEGWPTHPALSAIASDLDGSSSQIDRLTAVSWRAKARNVRSEDWDFLIGLASERLGMDYAWQDHVTSALLQGWNGSSELKQVALKALSARYQRQGIDQEIAWDILLRGFPQDDDIAQFIAKSLVGEHPQLSLSTRNPWPLLRRSFQDHPVVVHAIDRRFAEEDVWDPLESGAALVGCTDVGKRWLLNRIDSHSFPHWHVWALLEGWGMKDREVAARLLAAVAAPAAQSSKIAHLIPEILLDPETSWARLIELLRDQDSSRPDLVLAGLAKMPLRERDERVVDAALSWDLDSDKHPNEDLRGGLLRHYGRDPRVEQLALREFERPEGDYTGIAVGFANNESFRNRIVSVANPLPADMRSTIVRRLIEGVSERSYAETLLEKYDLESSPVVRTQASIAYHSILREEHRAPEEAIKKLTRDIRAYGPLLDDRRQAAFAGLVVLQRLDLMKDMREETGNDRLVSVSVKSENTPLLSVIADNWIDIRASFRTHGVNDWVGSAEPRVQCRRCCLSRTTTLHLRPTCLMRWMKSIQFG